jgi:hypothetical protein
MKACTINTILKKGIKDCRDVIKYTIKRDLPLNEAPSFGYLLSEGREGAVLMAHTTSDQKILKKMINDTLRSERGSSFLCTLSLRTQASETGFVTLLASPRNRVYAVYQRPPLLNEGEYHFEEVVYINEPRKALPFLFSENLELSH